MPEVLRMPVIMLMPTIFSELIPNPYPLGILCTRIGRNAWRAR
jgi:hypothetical protein